MLGIVIVSYHSDQMTIDYVHRELKKIDVPWVCSIVNNAATLEQSRVISESVGAEIIGSDLLVARPEIGSVYLVPSHENLGFAKGNNLGVEFLKKNFNCEYILFSNNDIEIQSEQCLSTLIHVLEGYEEIGAIGPKIISLDGLEQLPHDGNASIYRQIGWHLFPFLRNKKNKLDRKTRSSGFTYWISGAFMVMRLKDFLDVGMFDPNTFLYGEEPILAERLKKKGKHMYYENRVSVLHYEGETIVRLNGRKKSEYMVMESNCYYFRNYLHYNSLLVWIYKWTFKLNRLINC